MSHEPKAHEALRNLFDRTRGELDAVSIQRIAARAREIPERTQPRLKFHVRWAFALAMLAGLVATQAVPQISEAPSRGSSPPPTSARASETRRDVVAEGRSESTLAAPAVLPDAEDEVGLADGVYPDVLDDLAFDPGDLGEQDLKTWMVAAAEGPEDG